MNIYDNDNGKMYKFTDWCGSLYWFDVYNYNAEAQDYTDHCGEVALYRFEVQKMQHGDLLIERIDYDRKCLDAMTELTKLLHSEWSDGMKSAQEATEAAIEIMEDCGEWDAFWQSTDEMVFSGEIAFSFVDEDSDISEDDIDMDKLYRYGWGDGLQECDESHIREYIEMMITWLEYCEI